MVVEPCPAQKTIFSFRPPWNADPCASCHMFGGGGKIGILRLVIVNVRGLDFRRRDGHRNRQLAGVHLFQFVDQFGKSFTKTIKARIHQLSSPLKG